MFTRFIAIAVVAVLTGVACYFIARKSGRNPMLWFMAGVTFNFLAIGLLLLLENLRLKNIQDKQDDEVKYEV